jgi:hypothetical protein
VRHRDLGPEESGFEFDILSGGAYFLTGSRKRGGSVVGWAGPIELAHGTDVPGVDLLLGGIGALTVSATDARSGKLIEQAWFSLKPIGKDHVWIAGQRDRDGKVVFADIPAGHYRLTGEALQYFRAGRELDLSGRAADLVLPLQPASWIVVELTGKAATRKGHRVVARLLSGAAPGWDWESPSDHTPMAFGSYDMRHIKEPVVRLKTRPGTYTIRFQVAPANTSITDPALLDVEQEVTVPESGEVRLSFDLPEK